MTQRPQWQGLDPWTRKVLLTGLAAVLLIFLLPFLFLSGKEEHPAPTPLPTATLPVLEGAPQPVSGWDESQTLRFLRSDGEVEVMTLRDYLWGVVAAEMPAAFQPEALKAQAVAARTYCFHQRQNPGDKHPDADVCGDYTCCQAYLTRAQAEENWGEDASRYGEKITQALDGTDGLLCLYEGEPIDALFFSSAPGNTSDAVEVWGTEVPYLRSVTSPEGEEVPAGERWSPLPPRSLPPDFPRLIPRPILPEHRRPGSRCLPWLPPARWPKWTLAGWRSQASRSGRRWAFDRPTLPWRRGRRRSSSRSPDTATELV